MESLNLERNTGWGILYDWDHNDGFILLKFTSKSNESGVAFSMYSEDHFL